MKRSYTLLIAAILLMTIHVSFAVQRPTPSLSDSIDLSQYRVISSVEVEGVEDDLSGITFSSQSETLFTVINSPPKVLELDKTGKVIRTITLVGFDDTEGIVHVENNLFAITQERYRKVSFVTIYDETKLLNADEYRSLSLTETRGDNLGIEGIAWSPSKGLFLANEKSPSLITRLPTALFTGINQEVKHYSDVIPQQISHLPLDDIAGLHFINHHASLLVLSDESRQILETDFTGAIKSKLNLSSGPFGLRGWIKQPEGITMDDEQRLYIVGEPNELLILERPDKALYASN